MRKSRALHARDRLAVLLSLVPYLLDRGRVSVAEAATHFDLAPDEIRRAVRMIAVSGIPGETSQYQANDLFDISWDDFEENDHIVLTHQVAIDDSPRFSGREAAALIAGMQYLAALPENEGSDRIALLMGKLSRGASTQPSAVAVGRRVGTDGVLATVRSAIAADVQVTFDYRNSRGGAESRSVDPFLLESVDDDWYLRGWCHLRQGVRTFRVDRMSNVVRTDSPVLHRRSEVKLSERLFEASAQDLLVSLSIARSGLPLLGDYLTDAEVVGEDDSERVVATVRVAHEHGLTRLAAAHPGLVTVLGPPSARAAVAVWARAALERYPQEPDRYPEERA